MEKMKNNSGNDTTVDEKGPIITIINKGKLKVVLETKQQSVLKSLLKKLVRI